MIQVLQRSSIPQTSNWSGTYFAVSYSKSALVKSNFFGRIEDTKKTFRDVISVQKFKYDFMKFLAPMCMLQKAFCKRKVNVDKLVVFLLFHLSLMDKWLVATGKRTVELFSL